MIVLQYQQGKYKIKNINNWLYFGGFLVLTKSMSETRPYVEKKIYFSEHGYTLKLLSQKMHFKTAKQEKILTDKQKQDI